MKKLGIIGGAGPLASALFYETLVHECYRQHLSLPEILLLNYPFSRVLTPEEKKENSSFVRKELLHCLCALEKGGAAVGVLVCNTLHLELANITSNQLPFLSLPDLVLEEIRNQKTRRLLLLGTQNTCLSSLYRQSGVTIFCPSPEGQKVVDKAIDHVLKGDISENDAHLIEKVIKEFPEAIDGVILGCTDLPVLHHYFPIQADKPIYDSIKIAAKTIMRFL